MRVPNVAKPKHVTKSTGNNSFEYNKLFSRFTNKLTHKSQRKFSKNELSLCLILSLSETNIYTCCLEEY